MKEIYSCNRRFVCRVQKDVLTVHDFERQKDVFITQTSGLSFTAWTNNGRTLLLAYEDEKGWMRFDTASWMLFKGEQFGGEKPIGFYTYMVGGDSEALFHLDIPVFDVRVVETGTQALSRYRIWFNASMEQLTLLSENKLTLGG